MSQADVSLICVGTPAAEDGSPILDHLMAVARSIGAGLYQGSGYHVVVIRSTVFPGTTRGRLMPILESYSGKTAGRGFGLAVNPEFLREGSAVADYRHPSYTVVGALDDRSATTLTELYSPLSAPLYRETMEEAETLKVVSNAFHALKVGFANEVGRLCKAVGADAHRVMDLLRADTRLNISGAYLRPGFAFGGSCLPKDLRSLVFHGRRMSLELPILDAVLPSNWVHLDHISRAVRGLGVQRVAVLGLSFKVGTDDVRDSAALALVRDLLAHGLFVAMHDPDLQPETVEESLLYGSWAFHADAGKALQDAQVVVVTQSRAEFEEALAGTSMPVLKLA